MQSQRLSDNAVLTWYDKATVRHTQRIQIPNYNSAELIYPLARSPICEHPKVEALGSEARAFILTQAAYQFLYGVGLLETKFVIGCSLDIINSRIPGATDSDKLQALTVVIDEGYHAHVALDYIVQMKEMSGIQPIQIPQSNRKLDACDRASALLPESMRTDFQLLAVTLAENILTEEIATLGRTKELAASFTRLMMDHVRDEGRHANYFVDLMKRRWTNLPQETQAQFIRVLPDYLEDFLGIDLDRNFERAILDACGLASSTIDQVLADSQSQFLADHEKMTHKTRARLYQLLGQMGVIELESSHEPLANHSFAA